jgi:hypothetical protein
MPPAEHVALLITVAVFFSGVVFQLGRYSVRLERVERDVDKIFEAVRRMEGSHGIAHDEHE